MENKANVLVIGESGAGKSTLINAISGTRKAMVSLGDPATQLIRKYENEHLEFDLFDSRGFEYSIFNQMKIERELKKTLNKESIHILWYCVEATKGRLQKSNLKTLKRITRLWPNTPVIMILTKSIEEAKDEQNIQMVRKQLEKYAPKIRLADVVPVVAEPYSITETSKIPSRGLPNLLNITTELIPEAMQIYEVQDSEFLYQRKRNLSNVIVGVATTSAIAVGTVPLAFPDALILEPVEAGMIVGVKAVYGIEDGELFRTINDSLIRAGTAGAVAKGAISTLRAIPGINLFMAPVNGILAGAIVLALGKSTIDLMEKASRGEIDAENVNIDIEEITENAVKYIKLALEMYNKSGKKDNADIVRFFKKLIFRDKE